MGKSEGKRIKHYGAILIACIFIALVVSSCCPRVIWIPIVNTPDKNTSSAAEPYIAADAAGLQDILSMSTSKPIYISIPAAQDISIPENGSLTIPSGQTVYMEINGNIGLATASDASGRLSVAANAVVASGYPLVEKQVSSDGQVFNALVPATETSLITVSSGATLYLYGTGRIGGTLAENPGRNLVNVEKGGELTIDGDITFVSFPYKSGSELTNSTIYTDGILTINNAKVFSTYRGIFADQNSTLTINKGVFASVASNALNTRYAYAVTGSGTSYINGGTYYGLQGALSQVGGKGEIKDATTKVSTRIFTDINAVDADIAEELAAFYAINANKEGHTPASIAASEAWHGLYVAGEDNKVDKIVVSGGSYYSNGTSGYGIYVGNKNDGGEGYPATVEITGGSFACENQNAVYCSVAGDDGYGEGFLQVSGGRFKGKNGAANTVGIREQDLKDGYVVSDTADPDGYYPVEESTI